MSFPKRLYEKYPELNWAVLLGYRGSIAHGTYVPNSDPNSIDDKDVIGICIPPLDYYYGLKTFGSRGTKEIKDGEWDVVLFEFTKAIRLLLQGNPNILSILWLEPNHYIYVSPLGKLLIENRNLFVGKHVYHSFVGYAHGQLRRMTHFSFQGYMGEKRKRLVEKFGYDTKHGSHLLRILRQGIEFLNEGELHVLRQDAQQLLEIKRGEWPLERVKEEAERLFITAETAYVLSKLPVKPDRNKINDLCVGIAKMCLGGNKNG